MIPRCLAAAGKNEEILFPVFILHKKKKKQQKKALSCVHLVHQCVCVCFG